MSEDNSLRTDARENKDRILEVAREALTIDPEASLNSIAKAAGVGSGTLYRHFPTREALIISVYRHEIEKLVQLAPTLLNEQPPLKAFQIWCEKFAQAGRVKRGIANALHAAISDADSEAFYSLMSGAIRKLLEACEKEKTIKRDVHPEDVLVLLSCVLQIPPTKEGQVQSKRIISLIFRSIGFKTL